ncbi:MAG: hypothetical protein ACRDCB_02090 [Clostridium sp.]|uniref:hypothetical protein n=1 Tax=Clostridium TaxID=1485 RepID=UPI002152FB07|nr:hypothetical protein [Clostridium sp. LY3-2]MCR6513693.1 hypothetical protein [Clostridium sp. LY3-2]
MIQVFCDERGSGKTKRLIELANNGVMNSKGEAVYIDYSKKNRSNIDTKIRFVSACDFKVSNCEDFYGLLCGIVSQNYDIDKIYVDELLDIVSCDISETHNLFERMKSLSSKFNVSMYVNINADSKTDVPKFLKSS